MNKFIKIDYKKDLENTIGSLNEQDNNNIDISEINNREEIVSDEDKCHSQTIMIKNNDNDILTHFFWPTFNPPLQSPLHYHITTKKIKIDNWRMMEVVG